jgi:drug/metabolite transporter (DMT)-like permease
MDSIAKHLGRSYSISQIVWARYASNLALIFVIAAFTGRHRTMWITSRLDLQVARAVLVLLASYVVFTALRYIPLAQVIAIIFISPFIVVALAAPLLGERVDPRAWLAVLVGFAGALVIIRPGFEGFHWALLLPVTAALTRALYVLATRALGRSDDPFTTLSYSSLIGTIAASAFVAFAWTTPDLLNGALMVAMGIFGALSHFMMIRAYVNAPSATLAPFTYAEVAWSVLFGLVLFGEVPDAPTFLGIALIIAAGLYVLRINRA